MSHHEIEKESAISSRRQKALGWGSGAGHPLGHQHPQGDQAVWESLEFYYALPSRRGGREGGWHCLHTHVGNRSSRTRHVPKLSEASDELWNCRNTGKLES